ncbi:TIR domain-containing protein [Streptomyces griseoluteus]|uniref:toll/interleukin-1 receptor domain-containing protein n=1 Tax=Streptomyces griseoluteus TaxID=29306 RepID=UPI0036EA1E45
MERDAFISYSHKRDVPLAEALQRGLHGILRTPWLHRPGLKVFRDTTSLAASHDLSGSIKSALAGSRYFIYLASPEAAASRWVREEIGYWRGSHGMDHFLIALSDGAITWDPARGDFDWSRTTALPSELRGAFTTEPLWVDLRPFRDMEDLSIDPAADFRDKVTSLAAPLHGLPKDALDSADLRMQRKAARFLRKVVAALTVMLLLVIGAGVYAQVKRTEALERARTSASQALAARAQDAVGKDPRKAAQFALYANAVKPTGESVQALAQAVTANGSVARHLQAGNEEVANFRGVGHVAATNVAVSRNGRMLAYYSDFDPDDKAAKSRHIHLYDVLAAKSLPNISGGWPQDGGGMQFSADGRTLAVEASFNNIDVWDVKSQKLLRRITASKGQDLDTASRNLRSFSFSGDGRRVAATFYSPDQEQHGFHLAVWETATGREVFREDVEPDSLALGFDNLNRLTALDTHAGTVRSLPGDSTSWSAPKRISGFPRTDRAQDVTFSADGAQVFVGGKGELWDLPRGHPVKGVAAREVGTIVIPGAKDGFAFASDDRGVSMYDASLRYQRSLGIFTWPVSSISASGDGKWVAAGSGDGAVSLFSTSSFQEGVPLPNGEGVKPADMAPDAHTVFRSRKSVTDVWTITGQGMRKLGRVPLALKNEAAGQSTVIASGDGEKALTSQQGIVSLWDLRSGERKRGPVSLGSEFMPNYFLPDGNHLVGTTENEIQVIDTRNWHVVKTLPFERDDPGMALSASWDRTTLALVRGEELTVWKWKGTEIQQVRHTSIRAIWTLYGHTAVVSAKGEMVAVRNFDGRLAILRVSTGEFVPNTSATTGGEALAFTSDTRLLVQSVGSGSESRLQFWDTVTGEPRGAWPLPNRERGQGDAIVRLLAVDDGSVVSFGQDGDLVRRAIDTGSWTKALCALRPGRLSREEYDRYLGGLGVGDPCGA